MKKYLWNILKETEKVTIFTDTFSEKTQLVTNSSPPV